MRRANWTKPLSCNNLVAFLFYIRSTIQDFFVALLKSLEAIKKCGAIIFTAKYFSVLFSSSFRSQAAFLCLFVIDFFTSLRILLISHVCFYFQIWYGTFCVILFPFYLYYCFFKSCKSLNDFEPILCYKHLLVSVKMIETLKKLYNSRKCHMHESRSELKNGKMYHFKCYC